MHNGISDFYFYRLIYVGADTGVCPNLSKIKEGERPFAPTLISMTPFMKPLLLVLYDLFHSAIDDFRL